MTVHPLSTEEQAKHQANVRVTLDKTDLTDGDAAQTLALFNVKDKMAVTLTKMVMPESFDSSDASLISTTITVGDGGSATRFLSSTELNPSGTEVFLKGGALASPSAKYVYTGDDTVDAFFACTATYLLNTHTTGKLELYFQVDDHR
jgi:hypothetical protein